MALRRDGAGAPEDGSSPPCERPRVGRGVIRPNGAGMCRNAGRAPPRSTRSEVFSRGPAGSSPLQRSTPYRLPHESEQSVRMVAQKQTRGAAGPSRSRAQKVGSP